MTKAEERAYANGVRDTQKEVILWCKDMAKIHRGLSRGKFNDAGAIASYLFRCEAFEFLASDIKSANLYRDNDHRSK